MVGSGQFYLYSSIQTLSQPFIINCQKYQG
jgi:hypothetical protein